MNATGSVKHFRHERDTIANGDYREFICGWGAAFINISITFPINKVMFRQMLHGVHTHKAFEQLRQEGIRYLYRGLAPPLIQKTVTVSLMFGTYNEYRRLLDHHYYQTIPSDIVRSSTAAFLAGCTEAILTPFERVQMLLQDHQYHDRYKNTFHVFRELKSYGVREYYRGLTAVLCRNGPSNILFFGLRGPIKDLLPNEKISHLWWSELLRDFVSGAILGAVLSTGFYPVNVIRTKMQASDAGKPFLSVQEAFRQVYNERGRSFRKLFYGVHANYTRALLSWGIINASYEILRKLLYSQEMLDSMANNQESKKSRVSHAEASSTRLRDVKLSSND